MSDILLGALIGAGAVLAANLLQFLSSWRTSKKADANWRRDQRRDAYADLIQAADDFRKAASDLHVTPVLFGDLINRAPQAPGTAQVLATTVRYTVPSYTDRLLAFEERSHLLDRAASRVNLLGSREVQGQVNAISARCTFSIRERLVPPPFSFVSPFLCRTDVRLWSLLIPA